jgi:hypothetical protein
MPRARFERVHSQERPVPRRSGRPRKKMAAARQRGAIFVEALIVCSMLMTMLAGAIFFHRMYSAKIRAGREARLAAWQAAEEGCPSKFGIGQIFNLATANITATNSCSDDSCTVGGLNAQSDQAPSWLESGAKTGEVSYAVTAHERAGGQTHSMRAYNRVICNERRQNPRGDLASIGDYILDAVIQ